MKNIQDNFSELANMYARFRPLSPASLFHFLYEHVSHFDNAWDVGTGNGQVATVLAEKFAHVAATDISQEQLLRAVAKENIHYEVARAEQTDFPDHFFDLITIAQAIHWFDFDAFYKEVKRVAKPGAIIAAWTYVLVRIDAETDTAIQHLYTQVLGDSWDEERKYVDAAYTTIPFPFEEIEAPVFEIKDEWNLEQFLGYLGTWSAVKHYKAKYNIDPIEAARPLIAATWDANELKTVTFPVYMRIGRVVG